MLVYIQNTRPKILQIKQDYVFLGIISPYTKRKTQRRFRLKVIHTNAHSPCTVSKPRSIKDFDISRNSTDKVTSFNRQLTILVAFTLDPADTE
jgi:hypothetical protein